MFETERLTIRHFIIEDWKDIQKIALSNEESEFADCDYRWPISDEECQNVARYFSGGEQFWAVELKADHRVVCFVNFNGIDDQRFLSIGHVVNSEYLHKGYELEALRVLYGHAFKNLEIDGIVANWALADNDKIDSLKELGMKVFYTCNVPKFRDDADGIREEFEACRLMVTKDEWLAVM